MLKTISIDKLLNAKNQKTGFTLIEILVAIAIMMMVFGFIFSSIAAIRRKTHDQQRVTDLQNIQSALSAYYADQQFYPTTEFKLSSSTKLDDNIGNPLIATATKSYLIKIPLDPTGAASYCYKPQVNFSNNSSCDNSTTSCQYYLLCAQLESGINSTPDCTSGCSTYNFKLTPNSSSQ